MSFLNLQKDMILLMLLEHPGSKLLVCVTLVSGEQYSTFVAGVRPQRLPSHVSYCRAALHTVVLQRVALHSCATQFNCIVTTAGQNYLGVRRVSQMGGGPTTQKCFTPILNLSSKQMLVICVTQFTGVDSSHFAGNTIYSQTIFNLPWINEYNNQFCLECWHQKHDHYIL